jgi:hypothetical protein
MRNIRQNLFVAFIHNAHGVPVAAGLLYPLSGLLLSPVIAAAAMALSSVSVIGNALRLRGVRLRPRDVAKFSKSFRTSFEPLHPAAPQMRRIGGSGSVAGAIRAHVLQPNRPARR